MKERDDNTARRVNLGEIRPLGGVAAIARKGEIVRVIRPAVLPCHDMFNVMREPALFLLEQAVFATVSGTPADKLSCRGIHQAEPFDSR
jgi:hypothetical protein